MTVTAKQIVIIQRNGITYCKKWDGAAFTTHSAAAIDYDAETTGGAEFTLWEDANDEIFVGHSKPFAWVGFRPQTVGIGYGDFTFQYSNAGGPYDITGVNQGTQTFTIAESVASKFTKGSQFSIAGSTGNDGIYTCDSDATGTTDIVVVEAIPDDTVDGAIAATLWTKLAPILDSTLGFTKAGYLAWSIPGTWELRTVDSVSAFWIRASQDEASPTTAAKAYNLLRNVTLDRPVVIQPIHTTSRFIMDVNRLPRLKDVARTTPDRLVIDATHLALKMAELNLLWDCFEQQRPVFVWDGTFTSTNPSFTADAYYESYEAYIDVMPPRAMSPSKMEPFEYTIEFICGVVKTLADRLGANA